MKILVPVAAYHEYNTAIYVEKALRQLGHEARVITQAEYYEDHPDVDLFFGVDSAGPLDFPAKHLGKTVMWFIDSRHNNDPNRRRPDDDTNARKLEMGGGWVLQAQRPDWERCVRLGMRRVLWIPLAADPDVWCPHNEPSTFDVGFGGNVWDGTRSGILEKISQRWSYGHFVGRPDELARGYSRSKVGFNISSFYGTPVAYDVNMRVFEVMSCGRVLVTNKVSQLSQLGITSEHHCLAYDNLDQALDMIAYALSRPVEWRAEMSRRAREFVTEYHTYVHRVLEVLNLVRGD